MEIIPAIDIRGGRAVQLVQGDYARETVYNADPVAAALEWQRQGATRLHIVDLDGARDGRPVNRAMVEQIVAAVNVPVQIGGGVRSEADARAYVEAGIARVILGTSAVEDAALVERLVAALAERLVVGIDARDGVVMTRGWLASGEVSAHDLARSLRLLGVERFVYTDIARDGMLIGPNLVTLQEFVAAADCPVIASGGISSVTDLVNVAAAGAEAAIVGTALYEGTFGLADAQRAAAGAAVSQPRHLHA